MPDVRTHCIISKKRTGENYEELHRWIDEGVKFLKHNHRLERHFYVQGYKDYIEKKWGPRAIVEWLFHIAVDNLETANKFAIKEYTKNYNIIKFIFREEELSSCEFQKL